MTNAYGAAVITPDQTYYVEVFGGAGSGNPLRVAGVYPIRKIGTFVANGATPVVVPYTGMTIDQIIDISLNTLGGSQGAAPTVTAIVAGVSFSVTCTAGDTSIYNWQAQKP